MDIRQGITMRNISALASGSRQPEVHHSCYIVYCFNMCQVVDWYYQKQAVFQQEIRVLEIPQTFTLQYYLTNDTEKYCSELQIEV